MNITFLGASRTVTGSCFLVDTGSVKFLLDCGLFQGSRELRELNYAKFDFNADEIDFVLLSHAHIDHSGLLPKLVKHGFKGKIYSTWATVELCKIMLPDSGYIQEMEVERKNRKNIRAGRDLLEAIYTEADANKALTHFIPVEYQEKIVPAPEVEVIFHNAGHILGSAAIEVRLAQAENQIKLVYSGDLGQFDQPIVQDPVFIKEADYLIIESTYGARVRKEKEDKVDKKGKLLEIINKTKAAGGNLIIPAFAVERTQDLLYYLSQLEYSGDLDGVNIFVDSPLAISATEIFSKSSRYFDDSTKEHAKLTNNSPFSLPGLKLTKTAEESMELNRINGGAIIISASGMCDFGRIKHHLKHNLWRKQATVLFVGYQAIGTLGRRLLNGEKIVRIHGEDIKVRANIVNLEGFSAHADQTILLKWIKGFEKPPKKVFVVHGEESNSETLAELIGQELNIATLIPDRLTQIELTPREGKDLIQSKDITSLRKPTVTNQLASLKEELHQLGMAKGIVPDLAPIIQQVIMLEDSLRQREEE